MIGLCFRGVPQEFLKQAQTKQKEPKKKQKENKKKNVYQGSIRKNNLPIGNYRLRGWEYLATVFSEVGEI